MEKQYIKRGNTDWKEQQLIRTAERLETEINLNTYPFTEPTFAGYDILQWHIAEQAATGSYALVTAVEHKVSELTEQRLEVLQELQEYRERKAASK